MLAAVMPRPGEHRYYEAIGEEGRSHAINKPFSDPARGDLLIQAGAILRLLPQPPARVLECGCGTGWLTAFLAKAGYDAVGQDLSEHAIRLAKENPVFYAGRRPEFVSGDYEQMEFHNEFDAVVFFSSLHHAFDEARAIHAAHRALRDGGLLIASEPGTGHARTAAAFSEAHDITDKDMPPSRINALARAAGFPKFRMYPHADELCQIAFDRRGVTIALARLVYRFYSTRFTGIVVLEK